MLLFDPYKNESLYSNFFKKDEKQDIKELD